MAQAPAIAFKNYRLHFPAAGELGAATIRRAVARAGSIDELLIDLSRAYYADGQLSTQLVYAQDGRDIYLTVRQRQITEVQAPKALQPYFESLVGLPSLIDRDFEPHRALAGVYAQRAGIDAKARLEPTAEGVSLRIEPTDTHAPPTSLSAEFGNPGNRFVGRHFLDLDLRHSDASGDQFKMLWNTALSKLNHGEADDYNEETLDWSRVTTFGIWGINGRALDYSSESGRDGQLREGQLTWLMPIDATLRSRLLLEGRADYVNRESSGPDSHLREEYPSAQIGVSYSYSASPSIGPLDLDVSMTLRKGLRNELSDTGAKLDYLLWQPTISVNLAFSDDWTTALLVAAQLASDPLPIESQWVLGGMDNIAAYLPGIAVGDSGGYAELDLQYRSWEVLGIRLLPRVFAEYGVSRFEVPADDSQRGTAGLADIGLELMADWRYFETSIAAAAPLAHHGVPAEIRDDSDARLLFRLTAQF